MRRHVVPPTAIPAVWDLDSGGGFSSPPPAPPRGASVDEGEGDAAGSESKPVGIVGGGPSCAGVSAGTSFAGPSVGPPVGSAVSDSESLVALVVLSGFSDEASVVVGCFDEASVAVGIAPVELGTADCTPLTVFVSALVTLSEVGTGTPMGACDSTVSTSTALLAVSEAMAGSVGCAIEADVVNPVGIAAPDVIETPKAEVDTGVGSATLDGVLETVTADSLVGIELGTVASVVILATGVDASAEALVRLVTGTSPVGIGVESTVPDDTFGRSTTDVSLTGSDVSITDVSPTDVMGASVGVGLPWVSLTCTPVDAKSDGVDEAEG